MGFNELDQQCVNTIRFLAVDGVQKANSGHPGMPMGAAPAAYVLWDRFLKHDPVDPSWFNRDRFVLSAGHGSMLLYSLLHLYGYPLSLDDIKNFRQWGSLTPGHPESGHTPGVEATTGPLGQGLAHAVGMAVAEAHLGAVFNRPNYRVVDHHTYVLAGDGDLMEGVTAEASSLAGHLGLGKLIVLYDDNLISLAGTTSLNFTEDVAARYRAYGWQTLEVADGNDLERLAEAVEAAQADTSRPSLISVRTRIGFGSPAKEDTFGAHGSPLGPEEVAAAKRNLGWPEDADFFIPVEARDHFRLSGARGGESRSDWEETRAAYAREFPAEAADLVRRLAGKLPEGWEKVIPEFSESLPTRKAAGAVLQALGEKIPELIGGSADLNPSTLTVLKGFGDFEAGPCPDRCQGQVGPAWSYAGRNIHFGVREHAMGSIVGGLALHGGLLPFGSTFLVFADYMRPPMRIAALSRLHTVYVFTHDSIALGEDGPTHQPVEQLMNLRAVPNLAVLRPADANEAAQAWRAALSRSEGPSVLVFSRQVLPLLDRGECAPASGLLEGAYVLWQSAPDIPDLILIATGSEVAPALEAARTLAAEKINVRVVSMPCWELFQENSPEYRESVLPSGVSARVSIEAGVTLGWERYVGPSGRMLGVDRFGASAPGKVILEKYHLTAADVVRAAREVLEG